MSKWIKIPEEVVEKILTQHLPDPFDEHSSPCECSLCDYMRSTRYDKAGIGFHQHSPSPPTPAKDGMSEREIRLRNAVRAIRPKVDDWLNYPHGAIPLTKNELLELMESLTAYQDAAYEEKEEG